MRPTANRPRDGGVGYIVDGSLDGDSGSVLAKVALADAASGRQVWTERYDHPVEGLFAVEDELAQCSTTTSGGAVYRDHLAPVPRKRPGSLDYGVFRPGVPAGERG